MVERLQARSYPGLVLSTGLFADETHLSVMPVILTRGVRNGFA